MPLKFRNIYQDQSVETKKSACLTPFSQLLLKGQPLLGPPLTFY